MNKKEWYENIPKNGILCRIHDDNCEFSEIFVIEQRHITEFSQEEIDGLTPLTAEEIWQFMPLQDIKLKPFIELFDHDVKIYGDNAYLMWEFRDGFNFEKFTVFESNAAFNDAITQGVPEYRRKNSAALPFDLERAKNGDVVEWFNGKEWGEWDFLTNDCPDYTVHYRMKYPKKAEI